MVKRCGGSDPPSAAASPATQVRRRAKFSDIFKLATIELEQNQLAGENGRSARGGGAASVAKKYNSQLNSPGDRQLTGPTLKRAVAAGRVGQSPMGMGGVRFKPSCNTSKEIQCKFEDGSTYEGSVYDKNGYATGKATFASDDKMLSYCGTWKENEFHGEGRLEYRDGQVDP